MKNYIELSIKSCPKNFDSILNILYKAEVDNILEEENEIKVYFFEEDKAVASNIRKSIIANDIEAHISMNIFEERNWNAEWEKTIEPVYISDRIVVYPSWKEHEVMDRKDLIRIQIDPKMAFGTGHNETTRLVLKQMCEYLEPSDKTLLDFGSGSGILSIAGIKLGIQSALGLEIDPEAIVNAKENAIINEVEDSVIFDNCSIDSAVGRTYDVIAANIISSVIIPNIGHIKKNLKNKGKIFISGILKEEKDDFVKFLEQNKFDLIEIISEAEWLGIYGKSYN
jgi:ribosomal protein L11 methyltransferase